MRKTIITKQNNHHHNNNHNHHHSHCTLRCIRFTYLPRLPFPFTTTMGRRMSTNSVPTDCATSGYKRTIHDPATWRFLQEIYIESVDEAHSERYERKKEHLPSYSGFAVAVEVKDDGHRGRSIYAAEPIAKGTRVWKPTHLVEFHTPREMHAFLGQLDHDLQCDALLWAYAEKGSGYVALALDPASFVNHGETEDVINLDEDCVALRDIRVGEELLEDYSRFIGFDEEEIKWFSKIRGDAWKEGSGQGQARSTDEYNLLGAPKMLRVVSGNDGDLTVSASVWEPILALSLFGAAFFAVKYLHTSRFFKKQKGGI